MRLLFTRIAFISLSLYQVCELLCGIFGTIARATGEWAKPQFAGQSSTASVHPPELAKAFETRVRELIALECSQRIRDALPRRERSTAGSAATRLSSLPPHTRRLTVSPSRITVEELAEEAFQTPAQLSVSLDDHAAHSTPASIYPVPSTRLTPTPRDHSPPSPSQDRTTSGADPYRTLIVPRSRQTAAAPKNNPT